MSRNPRQPSATADGRPRRRYRSVSRAAVASVALGLLSVTTVFGWFFWVIPIAGLMVGWLALRQIEALPDETTGRAIAYAGIILSLLMWGVGAGGLALALTREVPHGYTRVTFDQLQPDPDNEAELLPPLAFDLQDKKVYIKGYMYPGRQNYGIKKFVLVPTLGHCSFCSRELRSTEMIGVTMAGDLTAKYRNRWIGIGGKFTIDEKEAKLPFGGFPYQIEADVIE